MKINNQYYLIVDLEATCCDDDSFPRTDREIIEIGAVMLNSKTLNIDGEFQRFIKPICNPILTKFCKDLTTIKQEDVDSADKYPKVISEMNEWLKEYNDWLFCSWGLFDYKQFQRDCQYHRIPYHLGTQHMNVKTEFSKALNIKRKFGLGNAIKRMGLSFNGTAHRGIDDARNIAKVIKTIIKNTN